MWDGRAQLELAYACGESTTYRGQTVDVEGLRGRLASLSEINLDGLSVPATSTDGAVAAGTREDAAVQVGADPSAGAIPRDVEESLARLAQLCEQAFTRQ